MWRKHWFYQKQVPAFGNQFGFALFGQRSEEASKINFSKLVVVKKMTVLFYPSSYIHVFQRRCQFVISEGLSLLPLDFWIHIQVITVPNMAAAPCSGVVSADVQAIWSRRWRCFPVSEGWSWRTQVTSLGLQSWPCLRVQTEFWKTWDERKPRNISMGCYIFNESQLFPVMAVTKLARELLYL